STPTRGARSSSRLRWPAISRRSSRPRRRPASSVDDAVLDRTLEGFARSLVGAIDRRAPRSKIERTRPREAVDRQREEVSSRGDSHRTLGPPGRAAGEGMVKDAAPWRHARQAGPVGHAAGEAEAGAE